MVAISKYGCQKELLKINCSAVLNDAAAETAEDLIRHTELPQPPQKAQLLLSLPDLWCCLSR